MKSIAKLSVCLLLAPRLPMEKQVSVWYNWL